MERKKKPKEAFSFKKIIITLISIILLIIYLLLGHKHHIYVPCIFHFITGLYCPGCGVTRMLYALITGDIESSFRYNQLLFISLPIFIFLFINNIYSKITNKTPLIKKIPDTVYYIYLVILIIFMILRNIFPFLAPGI